MVKSWFKTWVHCMPRMFSKQPHHMCYEGKMFLGVSIPLRWFCSCGHLNGGKSWEEMQEEFWSGIGR